MPGSFTDRKVSVALCTYNGAKFIREQLASINGQTNLPFEIVICDDGSVDGTVQIIEEFAKNQGVPIFLHRNEQRLGVMRNFRKAILLCKGDYIALSDQDDVWLKDKLQTVIDFFSRPENNKVDVVFSDLQLVDEELKSFGKTMWQHIDFDSKLQKKWMQGRALDILISKGNYVTGAPMVLKSTFIPRI